VNISTVEWTAADQFATEALTICLARSGTHHTLQGIVKNDAAYLVVRYRLATESFLFKTADLAISFASYTARKIKIRATKCTATQIHSGKSVRNWRGLGKINFCLNVLGGYWFIHRLRKRGLICHFASLGKGKLVKRMDL
jgi:hypothetical protein